MIAPLQTSQIDRVRDALATVRRDSPARFRSVFTLGEGWEACADENLDGAADALAAARLMKRHKDGLLRSRFMVRRFQGRWLITDFPWRRGIDSAFPLYPESEYFVRHMQVPDGAEVLDLCTGSGIYAIFAAERARHVVAVDINPRALALAKLNLALNGVADRVELRQGDLYGPVAGERFDYICANPPFEPVPPGIEYYLHSDGGSDGLAVVRRLLAGIAEHLCKRGVLEMVSFSLGAAGRLLLTDTVRVPPGFAGCARVLAGPASLREFAGRFRRWPGGDVDAWLAQHERARLVELYVLFLRCQAAAGATVSMSNWVVEASRAEELSRWTEPTPGSTSIDRWICDGSGNRSPWLSHSSSCSGSDGSFPCSLPLPRGSGSCFWSC